MAIRSKPYYWVECDGDGCTRRCPPAEWGITAWEDSEQAELVAQESGWRVTEDGRHLCPDCAAREDEEEWTEGGG